jgi:hypothetical protein
MVGLVMLRASIAARASTPATGMLYALNVVAITVQAMKSAPIASSKTYRMRSSAARMPTP